MKSNLRHEIFASNKAPSVTCAEFSAKISRRREPKGFLFYPAELSVTSLNCSTCLRLPLELIRANPLNALTTRAREPGIKPLSVKTVAIEEWDE